MGSARLYKTSTPFPKEAVLDLDYTQSADVVYFAHLDYPVQRATRSSHTSWTIGEALFSPKLAVPAAPTAAAIGSTADAGYTATTYHYLITAVGGTPEEESRPSAEVAVTNDLTLNGHINRLTLPAKPTGVERYIIYKKLAGTFGYIGNTTDSTFDDGSPQLQPVLSDAPPQGTNPFAAVNSYPSTVTFHNQRLMLARTRNLPNAVWGSQPANFQNMDVSRPAKPDDALSFALVSERVNSVTQMVSMSDALMLLTSDGVFATTGGGDGEPISPTSIVPKRSNSRGSSRLNPLVIDENIFYVPNRGSTVRALGYKFEIDGYQSNNVTIFSPHLFKGHTIVDWAYVEEPYSAIFVIRDDGALLCFTWEAEQQVWGWTQLDSPDARFLRVATISEGGFDRLYALVSRHINGTDYLFHERLALPHEDDITTACHLDCSITQAYDPPRNVIDGLHHFPNGTKVSAYYDGYVAHDLTIDDGSVMLPNGYEATLVSIGLPYTGEIETLPMVLKTQSGSLHVNQQNIARIVVRTVDTRGLQVGITGAELEDVQARMGGEQGLDDVSQRDYDISPPGHWEPSTTLTMQQNQPLPCHITGVFVEPKVSSR